MLSSENTTLRVIDIKHGTTVDGPGFRTSIYFAGCAHHCPGCHNPQTWDPAAGTPYTINELVDIIHQDQMPVTFSGGDPICQLDALVLLASRLHDEGINIWCYTGYTFPQLLANPSARQLLELVDVIVDGPFIESLRDTSLLFRGSSNQRIINVAESLRSDKVVLWESDF